MIVLQGKSAGREICSGKLRFYSRQDAPVDRTKAEDAAEELERFEKARKAAAEELEDLYRQACETAGKANAAVFDVHRMLLEDEEYCGFVRKLVKDGRAGAAYAVQRAGKYFCDKFRDMDDAYLRERTADVEDVSRRLLDILTGRKNGGLKLSEPSILAADDLTPSDTVQLPPGMVLGFALRRGSLNSHAAILAKGMGIPAVVGLGDGLKEEYIGRLAAIDGQSGRLYIEPDRETLAGLERKKAQEDSRRERLRDLVGRENITLDGRRVEVYANAGSLEDVENALRWDAAGIGLFRSELLYLESSEAPSEDRQFELYRRVLERMAPGKVVIRTLDIGADKQAACLGLDREENPALGCRAIRLCFSRPELFKTQLRALYRAGVYGSLSIMYPMVTSVEEVERIRSLESEVKAELAAEGKVFRGDISSGVMIETPAAALISGRLAEYADFFSIGTNDLTQYTLAADRQNAVVEEYFNPRHEAVMQLIRMTAENGNRAGIPVGICGELASDLALTEEFVRMGICELSVAPGMVLPLRGRIRELDLSRSPELCAGDGRDI